MKYFFRLLVVLVSISLLFSCNGLPKELTDSLQQGNTEEEKTDEGEGGEENPGEEGGEDTPGEGGEDNPGEGGEDNPGDETLVWTGNDQIYALFKDIIPEGEGIEDTRNTYVRNYFLMAEGRGDNVSLSGATSDPIHFFYAFGDTPFDDTNVCMWKSSSWIIELANQAIEANGDGVDHVLGEAYFFRAIVHFNLLNLYAKPYVISRDMPGLPVSIPNYDKKAWTVGDEYDAILSDLNQAVGHLKTRSQISGAGAVSMEAALALQSRVLLYMGEYARCLDVCNQLLGSDPSAHLTTDLDNYFKIAASSDETLWCIRHKTSDTKERASIGSMYYSPDGLGATGWAELYWTDSLIELFLRYPEDQRFQAYFSQYALTNDGTKLVYWVVPEKHHDYWIFELAHGVGRNADGNYVVDYGINPYSGDRNCYTTSLEYENGYPVYYIMYEGEKTRVYVRDDVDKYQGIRNTNGPHPVFMMSKFSGQDGDSNLSSPVMIRWAEVVLNRAEAEYHTGMEDAALDDVNVIRRRAGLPAEAMMTMDNYRERGYESVLDVILDERRMELCFEGHRLFDLMRNQKPIDRRFVGQNTYEVVDYTDDRLQFKVPEYYYAQ
ncbi:MAG: RagB/SusD family nutrient uptake outer membrane protein [Bacteroidales bacterium]|nr:RagB/SusD family nutrient uptake outer membrane protein [Bacteroidales bacterium]